MNRHPDSRIVILIYRIMLLFCFYFCFAAVVFSAAENLFSDDNEQSLSASLFTSEDLGPLNSIDLSSQPGNLNPTDLFQLSFDADPTEIDYSLVPTGSQDIFDLTLSENLPEFADDALFSENIIAANDCGLDNSRVQGRVRARGSTCSNTTPENGVSGSSPQKNKPPEENQKEPEPLAGGGVDDWDKTCKYNGLEDIMVCSSGNPGDDIVQRIPISGLYSLQYSSSSTCVFVFVFFCFF